MEQLSLAPLHQSIDVLPPAPTYPSSNGIHPEIQPTLDFSPDKPEPTYPTVLGHLTFEQLYQATCRIAGAVMRNRIGMNNPEDIDDCLQAGYLKVWQKLRRTPDWLVDKPKRYIVQAVVLRSKAQRFSHQRHYRKLVYDAEPAVPAHAGLPMPHRIDTWIDLQQAVTTVAEQVTPLDSPLNLLALYTVLTQVKTRDVAKLYGHGLSTLTAAKRQVRSQLAQELPGYGNSDNPRAFLIRKYTPTPPAKSTSIASLFFDEAAPRSTNCSVRFGFRSMVERQSLQERSCEPHYPTLWRGMVTLAELLSDPQVRKVAFSKARSLGYTGEDAQDCFQLGSLNLWKALKTQPTLLCDKGAAWVGIWIAFSGSRRALWKHESRSVSFEEAVNWRASDDWLSLHPRGRPERWAGWATRVDQRIDFALLMQALAQRYESDPLKLYALYSLTTSVQMKDLLSVAHAHKNLFIQARNQVKTDIRDLLELDTEKPVSDEFWTDSVQEDENLSYVTCVAERVQDNQRLLLALYIATTSAKRKDVAALFGIGLTAFRKEMTHIKTLLSEEMRKSRHNAQ